MKKLKIFTLLATSVVLLVSGCSSDKSSEEACQHQATMDLDHGNYNAVLASPCANGMQKGAAYFAKGGFDVKNVINSFIDANKSNAQPLDIYMNTLAKDVSADTLTYLGKAAQSYSTFASKNTRTGSPEFKDAKFNESLVSSIKGLSFLKLFITVEGTSALAKTCDLNGNGRADSVDAAICSLAISADPAHQTTVCPPDEFDVTQVANLMLQSDPTSTLSSAQTATYQGVYVGYIIKVKTPPNPPKTPSDFFCPASHTYERLFSATYDVVATSNLVCVQKNSGSTETWPCPVELNGVPIGLATTFDDALNGGIWALSQSLASSTTSTSSNDVRDSIMKIKKDNCCTPPEAWNPNDPASCTCTPAELGVYLSTI